MPDAFSRHRQRSRRPASRTAAQNKVLLALAGVGMVVVLVLVAVLLSGDNSPPGRNKGSSAERPSAQGQSGKAPPQRRRGRQPGWRGGTPVPAGPRTLGDLMQSGGAEEQPKKIDTPAFDKGSPSGKLQRQSKLTPPPQTPGG